MKGNEFRDRALAGKAAEKIKEVASSLGRVKLMHVCGTHEDTITRYGIRSLLPKNIELVSGPGCPVCVTTTREVDEAIELVKKGVLVTTFGDMLRVPGTNGDLADAKADGGDVRVVYSIMDAVDIARKNTDKEIAHIAVGFETTVPTSAVELLHAPKNFSILCCHRTVPAAMDLLLSLKEVKIMGFIDPGHVSAIIGVAPYRPLAEKYRTPHVVVGFEPLDVLFSVLILLEQIRDGKHEVMNEYSRVVKEEGNLKALRIMYEVFTACDVEWRGFPVIPGSGLRLRDEFTEHDSRKRFDLHVEAKENPRGCRCGDVLKGLIYPRECPLFGKLCSPKKPVGPCMVSMEGSCAIAYKYGGSDGES
jgi:hydrogenase expression/formation protein HypD